MHMKKIWKDFYKIKDWNHWMPWILFNFIDLMPSLYDQECKPNAFTHKAALRSYTQTWKFSLKVQNWFQGYKAIQDTKPISIASLGIPEQIPIDINHQNALNRYHELRLYLKIFEIVHHNLSILCTFYLLILVPYEVLKLTMVFNWIIMHRMRFCHNQFLGLQVF